MANILIKDKPQVMVGLGTMTYTIPASADGMYNVKFSCDEIPPSGLSVLVKNGVTTIFTAPTITPTQISMQFKTSFLAAATDVITVVVSSVAATDNLLNSVKSITSIGTGE